jgi:uncharacterized protein
MNRWRASALAAYVGPYVVFMLCLQLVGLFKVEHPLEPWWKQGPEHWIYPVQTVCCLALLAFWWRHYDFRPLSGKAIWTGVWVGVLGLLLWVLPAEMYRRYGWEIRWLGMTSRTEPGFDPTLLAAYPSGYWLSLIMRFVRMTLAVPLLEELVMRGFLWRYLSNPEGDFTQIPFGKWHRVGVVGSILAFTVGHQVPDLLGCVIYGILISYVALRTKSLGACVVCHGVTNFLLGIYVLQTQQWGFW